MTRLDLPEIADLSGCPEWLRGAMMGYLRIVMERMRIYDAAAPVIASALRRAGIDRIVDLGSGAGGPWPALAGRLSELGVPARVILTDIDPGAPARFAPDGPGVTYHPEPVSALSVPGSLGGMRTMFTALHHFEPDEVRALLTDAQSAGVPFAAFEVTRRSSGGLLVPLSVPFLALVYMPLVRPRSALPLLLTYLPPLVPLALGWDGLASTLRSHTAAELRRLIEEIAAPDYAWRVDQLRVPGLPIRVLQLLGEPTKGA